MPNDSKPPVTDLTQSPTEVIPSKPAQQSLLGDFFDLLAEGKDLVDAVRHPTPKPRVVRTLDDEKSDPALPFAVRALALNTHGVGGFNLTLRDGLFCLSVGVGRDMVVTEASTASGAILAMCSRLNINFVSIAEPTPVPYTEPLRRAPLDNKSRAAGERDDDE